MAFTAGEDYVNATNWAETVKYKEHTAVQKNNNHFAIRVCWHFVLPPIDDVHYWYAMLRTANQNHTKEHTKCENENRNRALSLLLTILPMRMSAGWWNYLALAIESSHFHEMIQ